MHIKKQLSLNSTWWHTQLNTSKVLEMDCSVLWNQKPRAWQLYNWLRVTPRKSPLKMAIDWPLHGTFRLQQPSSPAQRSQNKVGRAGRQPQLQTDYLWHEYIYRPFPIFLFCCLHLHHKVKFRPIMWHTACQIGQVWSYTPIELSQILVCRFNLSNY